MFRVEKNEKLSVQTQGQRKKPGFKNNNKETTLLLLAGSISPTFFRQFK